jgi:LPS-assembly protein
MMILMASDAFIQSLSVVTTDDTRIAAQRASRREGNTTEYENAKYTPCKNEPGMPPLWCISATRIIHDQLAATLSYQDAKFEFFGVPDPELELPARHRLPLAA